MNRDHLKFMHFHLHPSIPIPGTTSSTPSPKEQADSPSSAAESPEAQGANISGTPSPKEPSDSRPTTPGPTGARGASRDPRDHLQLHARLSETAAGQEPLDRDELGVERAYWGHYGGESARDEAPQELDGDPKRDGEGN